ncbi:DoxX family membrane protein [Phytoactinopolyspora alkaliphila]|uniref:DoxX family membrane protein n=1 Tax=Phytoactinopolyspora alkaliphila TaxID=1783498 RepID=A0A6N9YU86_9ACTN|nr:DoxX family membrane protein [Phytoactinopolyspora alkaliphila]NED98534.1 DoxX family membrane protein [Phytoactinopolyspora alkaliphila]
MAHAVKPVVPARHNDKLATQEPAAQKPAAQKRDEKVLAPIAGIRKAEPDTVPAVEQATGRPGALGYVLAALRFALGWTFLWAFLDKTFGFGYATPAERAWVNGGSPTTGYLSNVEGPFGGFFSGMAGHAWADWLFMIGLLGIGLALILGIGMRIAAVTGALLLVFMWMAALPLANNPFMDNHLTEALMLGVLALAGTGRVVGFGKVWERLPLVRKNRWLV